MSERLRSILAVAVLTLVVWVWADLEQTGESEDPMPVRLTVPAGYVLRSAMPDRVLVRYKGPLGEIQDLKASAADKVCRFDLTEADLKTGRIVLQARDGLRHLAARRVAVSDIKDDVEGVPDGEIHVMVDRLVTVRVRVEPRITGAVATVATAQPAEVSARVAESEFTSLPEVKRFVVAPLAVSSMPADQMIEQEVPLDRRIGGADGIEAVFDPPIVKITARLESTMATKALGRLPILVSAPPDVLNRYRIVFQPETPAWVEVTVMGPGPDIERLNPQEVRVQLNLTADDKPDPGSWLPGKPVVIGLPPGVKLAKPLPTVNFNLEKLNEKPSVP